MSRGRAVWVKVRASEAERAEWHAKARSAGLTLSDLVRRAVGPDAHVDRRRTPRSSGSAPSRWRASATTSTRSLVGRIPTRRRVEAVEVIAHLIAIRRALSALEPAEDPDADAP